MNFVRTFFQQQIGARAGAGAAAANFTSWSRSWAKMERLHNTGSRIAVTARVAVAKWLCNWVAVSM